jgi:hypothetical protein
MSIPPTTEPIGCITACRSPDNAELLSYFTEAASAQTSPMLTISIIVNNIATVIK